MYQVVMAADESIFVMIEEDLIDEVEEKLDAGEFDPNELDEVNFNEKIYIFFVFSANILATRVPSLLIVFVCLNLCQILLHPLSCLGFVVALFCRL